MTFKEVPHLPTGLTGSDTPTFLRIGISEGYVCFEKDVNTPGSGMLELSRVKLGTELVSDPLLPYGEVLESVIHGDELLSVSGETAEQCWTLVDPVLAAWSRNDAPMDTYAAGSSGPSNWG